MPSSLAVSACLLGHRVRYDGESKPSVAVADYLSDQFELIAVCPEDENGMGIPREPVHLEGEVEAPRMIGNESRTDWSDRMRRTAERLAREVEASGVCGYVFKSRSPSCGIGDVPVTAPDGHVREAGSGMMVLEIRRRMPGLPMINELDLEDEGARGKFLEAVAAFERRR